MDEGLGTDLEISFGLSKNLVAEKCVANVFLEPSLPWGREDSEVELLLLNSNYLNGNLKSGLENLNFAFGF